MERWGDVGEGGERGGGGFGDGGVEGTLEGELAASVVLALVLICRERGGRDGEVASRLIV